MEKGTWFWIRLFDILKFDLEFFMGCGNLVVLSRFSMYYVGNCEYNATMHLSIIYEIINFEI